MPAARRVRVSSLRSAYGCECKPAKSVIPLVPKRSLETSEKFLGDVVIGIGVCRECKARWIPRKKLVIDWIERKERVKLAAGVSGNRFEHETAVFLLAWINRTEEIHGLLDECRRVVEVQSAEGCVCFWCQDAGGVGEELMKATITDFGVEPVCGIEDADRGRKAIELIAEHCGSAVDTNGLPVRLQGSPISLAWL